MQALANDAIMGFVTWPGSLRRTAAWCTLAAVVLVGAAALVTFDDRGPVTLDDLDLLARPFDPPVTNLDRQMQWALAFANGAPADRADIAARFAPSFLAQIPVDTLIGDRDVFTRDVPYRPWAVVHRRSDIGALVVIGRSGTSYLVSVSTEPDTGRIDGLALQLQDIDRQPMAGATLVVAVGAALALAVAGVLVTTRSRRDRTGALLLATSVACLAQTAQTHPSTVALTTGLAAGPIGLAFAAHVFARTLPWPAVRRGVVGGAIVAVGLAVAGQLSVPFPSGVAPSLARLGSSRTLAHGLLTARSTLTVVVALALAVALAVHAWQRPVGRRIAIVGAGVVAGAITTLTALSWLSGSSPVRLTMSPWLDAALGVLALGVGLDVFVDRLELGGVAQMVTDLGDGERPAELRELVGRALGDPSVEVWFWSDELDAYVAADGTRGAPESATAGRVATRLSVRGEPLAVVVHDAALAIPNHRVAAVCAAARMALDNERLQARVRAQLAEVRASRARIVRAGDDARREVERNLHDGAQQRLLAVLLTLRRAEAEARGAEGSGPVVAQLRAEVGRAADELAVALEEVRAIARGLHPPALDRGLTAALDALAETAPLPVEVAVPSGFPSLDPAVDAAIYFFVAEALTNTVRHADATHLAVSAAGTGAGVAVVAADDGRGGATFLPGSALTRLADRAEALGGRLQVESAADAGTRLTLELPVDGVHP